MKKEVIISNFSKSLLFISFLLLAYFQINCQSFNNIKSMHVNNSVCNYSFQYTGHYDKDGPRADDHTEIPYSYLGLLSPKRFSKPSSIPFVPGKGNTTGSYEYHPAAIEFHVYSKVIVKHASEKLENFLRKGKNGITILDRSKIVIYGIEADQIIYEDTVFLIGIPEWHREVYFDYNNLNWRLTAVCDKDLQEEISADFDLIVRTFKIH